MSRTQFPNKVPQPMPGNVKGALAKRNLLDAYLARPAYQKDDYLKWIATAAGPAAKQQRIDQMVEEIEKGGVFKGEPWTPSETTTVTNPDKAAKAASAKAVAAKPGNAPAKPGSAPAKPAPAKPAAAKPAAGKPVIAKPGSAPAKPVAAKPAKK